MVKILFYEFGGRFDWRAYDIPIAVGAIQELDRKNQALEKRIEALEAK
jgi:hypothetical protein